jgi:hypothetical protein
MYPLLVVGAGLATLTVFVLVVLAVVIGRHPPLAGKPYSEGLFRAAQ